MESTPATLLTIAIVCLLLICAPLPFTLELTLGVSALILSAMAILYLVVTPKLPRN